MLLLFYFNMYFEMSWVQFLKVGVLLIAPTGRYNIAQDEILSFKIKR